MELVPGSSPQFLQLLTSFCGPKAIEVFRPMLPCFVLVRKRQLIAGSSANRPCEFWKNRTGQVFQTPTASPWAARLHHLDRLSEAIAEKTRRSAKVSEVCISLDSVIFSDDTVIGPDLAGKLEEQTNERRVRRQLGESYSNGTRPRDLPISLLVSMRKNLNSPASGA